MEFITIHEYNSKDIEETFYYCQWTGNEETLGHLVENIKRALNDYLNGHYSSFRVDTTKLPENIIDIQRKIFKGKFIKCTGNFTWFTSDETKDIDDYDLAKFLSDNLYRGRLPEQFSNYRNWYIECLYGKISREEYLAHQDE